MAKLAALAMVALLTLHALPHLLRPPQAPPLARDVGLPPVKELAEPTPPEPRYRETKRRHARSRDAARPKRTTGSAATDRIRARPRRRHPTPKPPATPVAPPTPPPVESPPSAPPPPPAVGPAPAPSSPGDGSEEFAPH